MKTKIICVVMCLVLVLSATISASAGVRSADTGETNHVKSEAKLVSELDAVDVMVAAYRFLSSEIPEDDIWSATTAVKTYEPVYDAEGNLIAHYVSFYPEGYVIINNNKENPMALEFSGAGTLDDIILQQKNINSGTTEGVRIASKVDAELQAKQEEYFEKLRQPNSIEKALHQSMRQKVLSEVNQRNFNTASMSKEDVRGITVEPMYEILSATEMPTGSYTYDQISNLGAVNTWKTTSDFDGVYGAHDHCGATGAYNVVNYYSERYGDPSLKLGTPTATFAALYNELGPGPFVYFSEIRDVLSDYVNDRGYSLSYMPLSYYSDIKAYVNSNQNKMCMVLLMSSLIIDMHYVEAVGYREYPGSQQYLRIVDNWNNSSNRFVNGLNVNAGYMLHIM